MSDCSKREGSLFSLGKLGKGTEGWPPESLSTRPDSPPVGEITLQSLLLMPTESLAHASHWGLLEQGGT